MSHRELSDRVVIVTGGAGLLGREHARALVRAGAHVVLADIDGDAVAAAAADVPAGPGTAVGMAVDVSDEASVRTMVRVTLEQCGRVDGLVNNAALNPAFDLQRSANLTMTFEDFPLEEWNRALAVNLTGMFLCARAVAPAMLAQRRGVIVNISSTYGLVGPDQRLYKSEDPTGPTEFKPVTYSVTKSAVLGFTRYLATYWGGTGIRVNTLTPGGVRHAQSDDFIRRYSTRTPLGRMAERHEYGGALVFLLSDASSYMTGSNLVIDGGWTAW